MFYVTVQVFWSWFSDSAVDMCALHHNSTKVTLEAMGWKLKAYLLKRVTDQTQLLSSDLSSVECNGVNALEGRLYTIILLLKAHWICSLKFLNSFKHFQPLIEQHVAQHIVRFMNMNDPLSPILFSALQLFVLEKGMQRSINRWLKHIKKDAMTKRNKQHVWDELKDWNYPWPCKNKRQNIKQRSATTYTRMREYGSR